MRTLGIWGGHSLNQRHSALNFWTANALYGLSENARFELRVLAEKDESKEIRERAALLYVSPAKAWYNHFFKRRQIILDTAIEATLSELNFRVGRLTDLEREALEYVIEQPFPHSSSEQPQYDEFKIAVQRILDRDFQAKQSSVYR